MKNQSFRISMIAVPLAIICGVLVTGSVAWADSDGSSGACVDRMLNGNYGFTIEGLVLPAPGVALPLRGVALTKFDGEGHLTQVDHVVVNGAPPALDWTPGAGTYHVNSDCTGTMRINVPSTGDFVNLRIVVVGQGREIHTVVTAPFSGVPGIPSLARTVTSVGIRRDY